MNYSIYTLKSKDIWFGFYEDEYKIRFDILNQEFIKIDKSFDLEESSEYKKYYTKKINQILKYKKSVD